MNPMEYYVTIIAVYLGTDLIAAWGMNLEFGVAGIANFAYILLVAAGGYTYAVLTLGSSAAHSGFQQYILGVKFPVVIAILLAMAVAAGLGIVLGLTGLRRLRPDYQALTLLIMSIAAGVIVTADNGLFNGNSGLSLIPDPLASLSITASAWAYVALVAALCVVSLVIVRRFTAGPLGRTLRSVRDDEQAASAIGKNVVGLRILVQAVGGALAGLSGALLVGFIGGWAPGSWTYVETFALLSAIIVGGRANNMGVFVGTAVVLIAVLQGVQYLPSVPGQPELVPDLGWMVLGIMTIAFLWIWPRGVVPERRPTYDSLVEVERSSPSSPLHVAPRRPHARPRRPAPTAEVAGSSAVLELTDVVRTFGGVRAVDGCTLSVGRGTITGLIGPNGAGKSTVMGIASGFVRPDQGVVRLNGRDVTGDGAHRRARAGLVRTFQLPREFGGLTMIENLLVAIPNQRGESALGMLLGRSYWGADEKECLDRAMGMLSLFGMLDKANEYARRLSGGQKRMLEIMRALMLQPEVLLLDEPMAGLSPLLSSRVEEACTALRATGMSMLLVEHEMGAVERLCDHVFVMAQGRVLVESSSLSELRTQQAVQDAYLVG